MEVSIRDLVRAWYSLAQDDPTVLRSLIDAKKLAMNGMLTKGKMNDLQNSQKNGISYTVLVSLPETSRIVVLDLAIKHIKRGVYPASRTIGDMLTPSPQIL
jgi:hypothetical protein